jgi:hypothetical protein
MGLTFLGGVLWLMLAAPATSAAGANAAAAAGHGCPPVLTVREQATAPAGWDLSYAASPRRLESVTFFDGPPKEQASLVYDEQVKDAKELRATWHIAAGGRGTWIACGYASSGALVSRRLPPEVRVCTVTYERDVTSASGLPAIRRIDCQ